MDEQPAAPRVLVAPDKFKGSLAAHDVAAALARGIREVVPTARVTELPVADGGDGTVEALGRAGFAIHTVPVQGPVGGAIPARLAVRGATGVVEIAETSGLWRMGTAPLEPLRATSYGLGEAILGLLARGCREVVVGLGGSASTDGGAGLLQALGAELTTAAGEPILRGAAGLAQLCHADLAPARARLAGVHLIAACDVTNPLFGEDGAARVYGPQKGASPNEVDQLDRWLAVFARVVELSSTPPIARSPGAGSAGGAGYALLALGAEFRAGADLVLDLLQFQQRLNDVNLVITGEGSLDAQSLNGKAPIGVAKQAATAGIPVVAAAGRVTLTEEQLASTGIVEVHSLSELEPDVQRSHETAPALLQEVGRRIAATRLGSC